VPITNGNAQRASDKDREETAERLRNAAAEGRLWPEELEDRLRDAFAARTYGELDAIVGDLPSPATVVQRAPLIGRPGLMLARVRPALPWLVALAAVLVMLMMAAVVVRRHVSLAAPLPGSPTTATAAPVPPPPPAPPQP
jgi:hypothetical protein